MSKLFKSLKKGLEEALANAEGKITLKSEVIEILESFEYSAEYIKRMIEQNITHKKFLQKKSSG